MRWNENVSAQIKVLRGEVEKECGFAAKFNARALGTVVAVDFASRGTTVGERENLRATDVFGAGELGNGVIGELDGVTSERDLKKAFFV